MEILGEENVLAAEPLFVASLQQAVEAGKRRLSEAGQPEKIDSNT